MNAKMKSIRRVAIALALLSPTASAQFPGDVFFSDPNPMVAQGQTVTLTVEIFTGTDNFGAILSMMRALELRVIVEGVETTEQLDILEELGYDEVQGNLFAPALAPGDIGLVLPDLRKEC